MSPFRRLPSAVLFDVDDTLYPERQFVDGGFHEVAMFVAARTGQSADDLLARLWELHDRDGRGRLFDVLLAEVGLGLDRDLVLTCLDLYRTNPAHLEPFPGVVGAIDALRTRGVVTGVVSDGNASVQRRKLDALGSLSRSFDVVIFTDELGPGEQKPSSAPFRIACRMLDVSPRSAVYVGNDPTKDFRGAREAGLFTIRIGQLPDIGGIVDARILPADDADLTLDSFDQLPELLVKSVNSTHEVGPG